MSSMPLVSVLTPTYNQAAHIGHCVRSVMEQSYPKWEQIVIDDGSTDSTPTIVSQYLSDRIKLVRRNHVGIGRLAETYNAGLELARGDIVAILEGDDAWPSSKLATQVDLFRSPDVVLSWGAGMMIDANGRSLGVIRPVRNPFNTVTYFDTRAVARTILTSNIIVPSSGVLVLRKALDNIGGFQQPVGIPYVDLPTWLRLVSR